MSKPSDYKRTRLNRGAQTVLWALREMRKIASAQEIRHWIRLNAPSQAPGLSTIYRGIEELMLHQMVQAVDFGSGEKFYEPVEPGKHHHHLICTSCQTSIHFEHCVVDSLAEKLQTHYGFRVRSHVLEIFGLCESCSNKQIATGSH